MQGYSLALLFFPFGQYQERFRTFSYMAWKLDQCPIFSVGILAKEKLCIILVG